VFYLKGQPFRAIRQNWLLTRDVYTLLRYKKYWQGVTVLGLCTIGNNVTIATGAVVCSDFPEDNIVIGGIPADILKRIAD